VSFEDGVFNSALRLIVTSKTDNFPLKHGSNRSRWKLDVAARNCNEKHSIWQIWQNGLIHHKSPRFAGERLPNFAQDPAGLGAVKEVTVGGWALDAAPRAFRQRTA
jgi:hypothetical protein